MCFRYFNGSGSVTDTDVFISICGVCEPGSTGDAVVDRPCKLGMNLYVTGLALCVYHVLMFDGSIECVCSCYTAL